MSLVLVFTGYGDSPSMAFFSTLGVQLAVPAADPQPGSGVDGIIYLPANGKVASLGGGAPNFATTGVGVFNGDWTVFAEGTSGANGFPGRSIARDSSSNFYGGKTGGHFIFKYDDEGNQLDDWDVGGGARVMWGIGVTFDGSVAYFTTSTSGSPDTAVFAWNLSGDSSLGTFKTEAGYTPRQKNNLLCLSDDSVVIGWHKTSNPGLLRRYNSGGSTVQTYTLPGTNPDPVCLTPGQTDDTFWCSYYDDTVSTFSGVRVVEINASDGAILNNFTPEDGSFQFDSPFSLAPYTPTQSIDNSVPCCDDINTTIPPKPGQPPKGNPGKKLPPVSTDWTPNCSGGGTVPTQADIVDSESWGTVPMVPCFRFVLSLVEVPPSSGTVTLRWSQRPLADAAGWSEGRIESIGEVTRSATDQDGNYELSQVTLSLSDGDHAIRTLLEASGTQYFYGREGDLQLLSEAGRLSALSWRTVFRGVVTDVQTKPGHRAEITLTDLVGSKFSAFDLDKTIGVSLGDEHTAIPDDSRKFIYPIVVGEHNDAGALDANGEDAAKGLLPVIDCGDYDISGGAATPTYLDPPSNVTAVLVGAGSGSRTVYYAVTSGSPYGESRISNIVSVSGCPAEFDGSTYVQLTWDAVTGATFHRVVGRNSPSGTEYLDIMNNGGTFVSPETEYHDDDDHDIEKPMPNLEIGTALVEDTIWGRMLVSIGCTDVDAVYWSDLADGTEPRRVLADPTLEGIEWMTADSPDWPYPDRFLDLLNATTGETIRGTYILVRGPRLNAHRSGAVTIAVNGCGMEDVGDGTGTMVDQAFYAGQLFINEHILKDAGTGYRTGSYGPLETFANGNAQLWTSAWTAAQAVTIARIGGTGYLAAWSVHQPITVREWVRLFCLSFDARLAVNHYGQIFPILIDDLADPTAGRAYRQFIDAVELLDDRRAADEIEDRIDYSFDHDADGNTLRTTGERIEDADAIAAYVPGGVSGDANPRGVHQGGIQELEYCRDPATALDSRQRRLDRNVVVPRYVTFATDFRGLENELGSQIRFTHNDGKGATGDSLTPMIVLRHGLKSDYADMRVELTALDVERITA